MTTPIQLVVDFSSPEDSLTSSPPTLPRRNSLQNPQVTAQEETTKTKKKKKKSASSSSSNRIWNEEDEVAVLKGLVDYRVKTDFSPKIDWGEFYGFVRGSIVAEFSKEQVLSKVKKLKKSFVANLEKINLGIDPLFTRSTDSEAFGFSMMLWGQNDDDDDDANQVENNEETVKKDEEVVANDEPLTEEAAANNEPLTEEAAVDDQPLTEDEDEEANDEPLAEEAAVNDEPLAEEAAVNDEPLAEEAAVNDEPLAEDGEANDEPIAEDGEARSDSGVTREIGVDTVTENETAGQESHGEDEADQLCYLQDALETTVPHGMREYQKKFYLEKLMNNGTRKRKELSDEWKALCAEEIRLKIKKMRFSAKLLEAANNS